jgi:DNA invertase Pin-like site-specific DNA recombinase
MKSAVAYVRVSTAEQSVDRQVRQILEWATRNDFKVVQTIGAKVSAKRDEQARHLDELKSVAKGEVDAVIVSELSRLGRSVGQIVRLVDELKDEGVAIYCIQENLSLNNGRADMQSKVALTLFSLMAEIESLLISERVTAGMKAAKARGVKMGRPKGKSKLDPHAEQIWRLLDLGVTKTKLCKRLGCCTATLDTWLKRHTKQERMAMGDASDD